MERRLIHAQALKRVRVGHHLTALLDQRGALRGDRLVLRHADVKHLLGLLPGWDTTQGGQTQRHAPCILDLAHAVLRGEAEQRCDRIGAHGQADWVEPERRGGLEWGVERGRQLAAHRS